MRKLTGACRNNNDAKVKVILENIFDINPKFQDENGYTSLIYASYKNHTEIVKMLLQYENYSEKINPNIQNKYGNTSLTYTSYHRNTEIVKSLLQYGNYSEKINPNLQDNYNMDKLRLIQLES